jgi:hypothetical protein
MVASELLLRRQKIFEAAAAALGPHFDKRIEM